MKSTYLYLSILAASSQYLFAASATINLGIAQLRSSNSTIIADGGGTWALIVAAGAPGTPQTPGALPGGLTLNSSLSAGNIPSILSDFENVTLTVGSKGSYYIQEVGTINGLTEVGAEGAVLASVIIPVRDGTDPGFTAGTLWGFYWFPGSDAGDTLSGSFEVGGFANSVNVSSGDSDIGTTVPSPGTATANFYEASFNQVFLDGVDTGLSASRFTAVAVPEASSLALSALGLGALLRRRRK